VGIVSDHDRAGAGEALDMHVGQMLLPGRE
jgi:hypothetical protein